MTVAFPARASETGKLYGSITTQMIAEAVNQKAGLEINRRQIEGQPLRTLGEHTVEVRLTVDLIPTVTVIVHREGELFQRPRRQPRLLRTSKWKRSKLTVRLQKKSLNWARRPEPGGGFAPSG
jgi:hypothetical protein